MKEKARNGMPKMTLRAFDMFCGAGGSSRGASMAGVTVVGGLDMWDKAIASHTANFPRSRHYHGRASEFDPEHISREIGPVDFLLASPECTSHSVAKGSRPGCENSRATAFEVTRFAKVLRPRWIIVENVIQMKHWHRFDEWTRELAELGYEITLGTLDASYHSTPQSRRRLFVVCDRQKKPSLPSNRRRTSKTIGSILGKGEPKNRPWPWSCLFAPRRAQATLARAERAITELGSHHPFILVYYGSDGAGGYQTLDRPLRTITTIDRFAYVRPTANCHEMRMLQPTELAAAMGFPSNHKLPDATRREKIKLIGNAVCPQVMRHVIEHLVKSEP